MRSFWLLLPFFAIILVLDVWFMPIISAAIGIMIVIAIGLVVFLSATRMVELNASMKIERNELRNIIFALEDALIVYDRNFKFLYFNPAAEKLFELKSPSVLGRAFKPQDAETPSLRRLAQVIFPSLAPSVVNRTPAGTYPQVIDLSFEDPPLELRVRTTVLDDGEGHTIGFLKFIRNRTRELFLVKSKSEFVTIASHQLRGPVTDLNWALETLSKDASLPSDTQLIVQSSLAASKQLMHIIEDLLNVSKIEEGRFGYNFEVTDMAQFVEGVLAEILPSAGRVGARLYFDRPKEVIPQVMIDRQKIKMALYNFVENAIRYNVKNGEVVVGVAKAAQGPFIEVSVKDTGIGISAEDIKKMFLKFFRAENALKFKTEGSGLGLYITKNIVRAHGGQVWAESELNRGSTFHFSLPTDFSLIPQHEVALEE